MVEHPEDIIDLPPVMDGDIKIVTNDYIVYYQPPAVEFQDG